MIKLEVDSQALKALQSELKAIDPGLEKQFKKDLKNEFSGVASNIQAIMPKESPLSGFVNSGRTKWSAARVAVSVTPGAGWGRAFIAFAANGSPGTKIVEFAGKGKQNYVKTPQGRALVRNLNARTASPKREGRFFFQAYKKNRTFVYERTQKIIDRYVMATNKSWEF